MAAYEVLLLNTAIPQIQAAQSGDTYVVPRDIAFSAALTLSAGTANGVPYLNGSKVLTTGSALTFDGTTFKVTGADASINSIFAGATNGIRIIPKASSAEVAATDKTGIGSYQQLDLNGLSLTFLTSGTEGMRLTSTGLGIGTSSPTQKLTLVNNAASTYLNTTDNTVNTLYGTSTGLSAGLLGTLTNHPLVFYANNAERMRLDSSGNLGLGVTPESTWAIGGKVIQISGRAYWGATFANELDFGLNAYYDGAWKYLTTSTASAVNYSQQNGKHIWQTTGAAASHTKGDPLSWVDAMTLDASGNLKVGGTADRATTAGTNHLDIFNGTAPVGTLTNGISIYSSSGEAYVMDAAGNATLFSPHDAETNEWIFKSKHTPTGKVLKIDVERLLKFVNDHFGLDAVHEFVEE